MDSSERIRLFNTIQAQVEGELVMTLQRHHYIRVCQHSTNGIIAAILESAELVRVNLPALHTLISQTKQIVYDRVTKSIHFFSSLEKRRLNINVWLSRFGAEAIR